MKKLFITVFIVICFLSSQSIVELSFFTRCALFYEGLMNAIGANLFMIWPLFGVIMFLICMRLIEKRNG